MIFEITNKIFDNCTKFAKASVDTNLSKYRKRNQFNVAKITNDIRNGKIGEEIVYKHLSLKFPYLNPPDHKIYPKSGKSWEADLIDPINHLEIAVKAQDLASAQEYGESWVFQNKVGSKYDVDKAIFNEKNENHYVAFVSLNIKEKTAQIKAIIKVQWLHDKNLFKEMKKEKLKNNKVAIYFDDLKSFENELYQL